MVHNKSHPEIMKKYNLPDSDYNKYIVYLKSIQMKEVPV